MLSEQYRSAWCQAPCRLAQQRLGPDLRNRLSSGGSRKSSPGACHWSKAPVRTDVPAPWAERGAVQQKPVAPGSREGGV